MGLGGLGLLGFGAWVARVLNLADGRQRRGTAVKRKPVERRWRRSGAGGGAAERCLRRRRAAERRLRQRRAGGASLVAERWSGACGGRRAGGAARWERRSATGRREASTGARWGRGGAMQWSAQGYPRGSRGAQATTRVVTRLAGAAGGADSG
ncbi:hypothetical protein U1Q18_008631 [Sarracenia purpurea var. burkii]